MTSVLNRACSATWSATCRALIPAPRPLSSTHAQLRAKLLAQLPGCVYCGDCPQTMDHFRPVIGVDGLPTGYCSDGWNMLPACMACNASKGNTAWRLFMARTTGKTPIGRAQITTREAARRVLVLQAFERAGARHAQRWRHARKFVSELCVLRDAMRQCLESHAARVEHMYTLIAKVPTAVKRRRCKPGPCNLLPTTCKSLRRSSLWKSGSRLRVRVRVPVR